MLGACIATNGHMGLIPDSVIAEIRERTNIVDVIGSMFSCARPDRTTKAVPVSQREHPFVQREGHQGLLLLLRLSQEGAMCSPSSWSTRARASSKRPKSLAARIGVEIPKTEEPEHVRRQRSERVQLLRVNKLATEFYRAQLCADHGEAGRRYLAERGIGDDVAENFHWG